MIDFDTSSLRYSAANRRRILDAYVEFVSTHFTLHETDPSGYGIGYLSTHGVAKLATIPAEQLAAVEYTLARLEQDPKIADGARYLRALYYRDALKDAPWDMRFELSRQAHEALRELAYAGDDLYHRKALSTLASDLAAGGDHEAALKLYTDYVERFPNAPWAQVAALRIAGDSAGVGDFKVLAAP